MYRVIHFFTDLQDSDHPYNVGDLFPREGEKVPASRLEELSGSDNKQGVPLIEEVPDKSDGQEPAAEDAGSANALPSNPADAAEDGDSPAEQKTGAEKAKSEAKTAKPQNTKKNGRKKG